ncbi:MAG: phosphatase PAP2 family protein [Clostridia bacterium]|nr:phosphatase PAP2 family protein [Clostridia bacterium]
MEKQTNNTKKAVLIFLGYAGFALIACLMKTGALAGFDNAIRDAILSLRCGALTALFVPIAHSGSWFSVMPILIVLLALPKTRWSYGIPAGAATAAAQLFYQVLKRIFRRARPDMALWLVKEHGFSFPSGHSITSFLLYSMLIVLFIYYYVNEGRTLVIYRKNPKPTTAYFKSFKGTLAACLLCELYIALMGITRVYVGVHWPSDVLASWCLGIANITILYMVFCTGKPLVKEEIVYVTPCGKEIEK